MILATIEDLKKELWLRKRNDGELKWVTKEGKQISIKDMSERHIINCLNLFNENNLCNRINTVKEQTNKPVIVFEEYIKITQTI